MMEHKCPSLNMISILPQSITDIILCRLPIKEAARTSILSRDWRYKWTTIPKLAFYESTMYRRTSEVKQTSDTTSARKNMDQRLKLLYAIQQVLLLHQGPINEFTLSMMADRHCFEIDQIILHLSRNPTLKTLTLYLNDSYINDFYKLPLCAFSLNQLTSLDLSYIDLDHQPVFFSGFPSLRSLRLDDVDISTKALLHLLFNCPALASFDLSTDLGPAGDCTAIELFECLPAIKDLTTYVSMIIPWLVVDTVPKEISTTLLNLKYFCLKELQLTNDELCFLLLLIKCSPNLEKICLQQWEDIEYDDDMIYSDILEEYSDVWLEHLNELQTCVYIDSKPQFEFVKFILARSPRLKKVSLYCDSQEVLEMLKNLPRPPCASPLEIVVLAGMTTT